MRVRGRRRVRERCCWVGGQKRWKNGCLQKVTAGEVSKQNRADRGDSTVPAGPLRLQGKNGNSLGEREADGAGRMMGWGRILVAWSLCLGLLTFLLKAAWRPHKSLWFLRSLIIIHHRMRTQNGQQRAQEAFFPLFFKRQTQGSTAPFWGHSEMFL